ncbi:hypothetical protein MN0502_34520 (plasmid) [Arthrobacter sp. MN05-02]|nr:hypothetical protein MN0502_34520 [Arthrobacter sp. MN05-02]
MTRIDYLSPEFVESFPQPMTEGALYVSLMFNSCGHLCCCGCEREVITPLSPAQWSITYNGQDVSLTPSIGSWEIGCKSHYWIRNGSVQWSRQFTMAEIRLNQDRDQVAIENFDTPEPRQRTLWQRVRHLLNGD